MEIIKIIVWNVFTSQEYINHPLSDGRIEEKVQRSIIYDFKNRVPESQKLISEMGKINLKFNLRFFLDPINEYSCIYDTPAHWGSTSEPHTLLQNSVASTRNCQFQNDKN